MATQDRLAVLTDAQVAALDAPSTPYWVAKLTSLQRLALSAEQISAFAHWSLFTTLPASLVPLIPTGKIPSLGNEVANTSDAWKAAITPEQYEAMTDAQRALMARAGF